MSKETITEKLQTVADNQQRIHAAGYNQGYSTGSEEGYSTGYDNGFGTGHAQGLVEGKNAEYDAFWDAYQANGARTNYEGAFSGSGWTDRTFKPKYCNIVPASAYYMFYGCRATDGYEYIKDIDFSKCTVMNNTFSQCAFTHIGTVDFKSVSNVPNTFAHARGLKTIDKLVIYESNTFGSPGLFENVQTLEDITIDGTIANNIVFAGTYSGKPWGERLTKASLQSIISHLYDGVSGKIVTLSLTAVNNAFAGGSDGSEWKALIATKPNWTISLV